MDEEKTPREDEESLEARFPELPPLPELPKAPKIEAKLPPRPSKTAKQREESSYGKSAIVLSAVSAFLAPIVVLCLAGYWLDVRLKNKTYWFAFAGVIVGMITGTISLVGLLQKISEDPK